MPISIRTRSLAALLAGALSTPLLADEPEALAGREPLFNPASSASVVLRAKLLFPDSIAALQNASFPGSVKNDRKLGVGSMFSGLYRDPSDPFLTFWGVTDRGPNEQPTVGGQSRRTFPVPDFDPTIFFMRVQAGQESPAELKVYLPIPIRTTAGQPVTGLPNRPDVDETPYDVTAQNVLTYNMDGLDTEGIVRTADGQFWICEEYGPSLLLVGADGIVKNRYVPVGSGISGTRYPTTETLPALYARRKVNRGFESIAISKDGSKIFTILQSPIYNPDKATGDASRMVRMLVVDTRGVPTAEYVMVAEPAKDFNETKQTEMKVSDAVWVNAKTLLVDERTDKVARIYTIDLSNATNLLGTKWDDAATKPSLEALKPEELAANGVVPVTKKLVADLNALVPNIPDKIEGLALLDRWTIVVGNDNEFNSSGYDASGNTVPFKTPQLNELLFIRLSEPLAIE